MGIREFLKDIDPEAWELGWYFNMELKTPRCPLGHGLALRGYTPKLRPYLTGSGEEIKAELNKYGILNKVNEKFFDVLRDNFKLGKTKALELAIDAAEVLECTT